jgi:hypothetical protein
MDGAGKRKISTVDNVDENQFKFINMSACNQIQDLDILNMEEEEKYVTVIRLSEKINWLADLGGTENILKKIIEKYTNNVVECVTQSFNPITGVTNACKRFNIPGRHNLNNNWNGKIWGGNYKTYYGNSIDEKFKIPDCRDCLIFVREGDGNVCDYDGAGGHWIFDDANGNEYNSYNAFHQKRGSNQFCQSFAIINMIHHFGNSEYYLKLMPYKIENRSSRSQTPQFNLSDYEYNILGMNICVVIDFWENFILNDNEILRLCVNELINLNIKWTKENKNLLGLNKHKLLDIIKLQYDPINWFREKFNDIRMYAKNIAKYVDIELDDTIIEKYTIDLV